MEMEDNLLPRIIKNDKYNMTNFFSELHISIQDIIMKYDNLSLIIVDFSVMKKDFSMFKELSYSFGLQYMGDISRTIEQYLKFTKVAELNQNFILDNILKILEVYKKTILYINITYKTNLIYNNPYVNK